MNESEDYKRGFNVGFDQGERNGKTLSDITIRQQQAEIEALKRPNNVVGVPQDKLFEMQATIHEQQAEIEALKKFKAEIDAENKKLFEAVQRANDVWDKATGKAQEK